MTAQEKDAAYAQLGEELAEDAGVPQDLRALAADARVTVRRGGAPALRGEGRTGQCVVYWMQRAQRGRDNHALDVAIACGDALGLPVVAYFAVVGNFPHANLRHYTFLNQGLPDIERDCAERGVGFVMRRAPNENHERFFAEVGAAMVIGDENPVRELERWRVRLAQTLERGLRIPFWTVDADVIVSSRLLGKAQFSAAVARPRFMGALAEFLKPYENPKPAQDWKRPRGLYADDVREDVTRGWPGFDRSVKPVPAWTGGPRRRWPVCTPFATICWGAMNATVRIPRPMDRAR